MKRLALLIIVFYSLPALSITTDKIKILFNEGADNPSLILKSSNNDSNNLVKSQVLDESGKLSSAFIVTPPLIQTFPGGEAVLRFFSTNVKNIPETHESRETLVIESTPELNKENDENKSDINLQYHLNRKIKMYLVYRPKTLQNLNSLDDIFNNLHVFADGNSLKILNNSHFYIDLTNITVNKKKIYEGNNILLSIPPFASRRLKSSITKGTKIQLTIINDNGLPYILPTINIQ